MIFEVWKQRDVLCKDYLLSSLEDDLYNVLSELKTSKELWNALENKYKAEDACFKRFDIAIVFDYMSKNNEMVWSQVQEL